jgi:GTP cyclohydrolase I
MKQMTQAFTTLLTALGEDVKREGLKDTPERAAKALQFLTQGYNLNIKDIVKGSLYARRLQIQENLTQQIAGAILDVTNAIGVGVVVEAAHLCIMARGVEKQHAMVQTNAILGSFRRSKATRQEFFNAIK